MIEALGAGTWRHRLALAWLAMAPSLAIAQPPATKPEAKEADAKAAAPAADEEKQGIVDKGGDKQATFEVFEDRRAKALIKNTFRQIAAPRAALTRDERSALRNMAAGVVGPNRELIGRLLDWSAADLTNQANIKAILEQDNKIPRGETRAIEQASQFLMELLLTAQRQRNQAFLNDFVPLLYAKLAPLLEGHLFSRMEAIILLATAATPQQADVMTRVIADPKQPVWVKLWAARGLTNATSEGRANLAIEKGTAAVKALVDFLDKEPDAFWPVKLRVLEALGSLRLASTAGAAGTPDVAALVVLSMTDPNAKIDVRAWAAHALGMLTVPASVPQFNMKLVAYQIGRLAAEVGDRIAAEADRHKDKFPRQSDAARYLTGLLIFQVDRALGGEDDVANSGLLQSRHPAAVAARPMLTGLDEKIKDVAKAANELLIAGGGQIGAANNDLKARVADLKSFLDKNKPTDPALFPGGPKLPLGAAQVAGNAPKGP